MNSNITPPPNYKLISYKEWGGRFLPKTSLFYHSGNWHSIGEGICKWSNKYSPVCIPNNHIPRKLLIESNDSIKAIVKALLEVEEENNKPW